MKKYLLFILCSYFTAFANAQTETYTIDWSFGSIPSADGEANANRTIEEGDTVIWNWYASGTHNVVSEADATESFDSGLLGPGSTFSYTFTQVGTNDYVCTPHSGNMFGTITVVPEGSLNTEVFTLEESIAIYPNPTSNQINIQYSAMNSKSLSVSIFNSIGQIVKDIESFTSADQIINISSLESGLYFVKISQGEESVTKKLIVE
jgi:plastocyanin